MGPKVRVVRGSRKNGFSQNVRAAPSWFGLVRVGVATVQAVRVPVRTVLLRKDLLHMSVVFRQKSTMPVLVSASVLGPF